MVAVKDARYTDTQKSRIVAVKPHIAGGYLGKVWLINGVYKLYIHNKITKCSVCFIYFFFTYFVCYCNITKLAAQPAGTDPARCSFTNKQNSPIQKNGRNF